MPRLVGLDLDGTLIDSAPDLSDALGQALESLGLPRPTEADTRTWVGDGIETLIERGLTHAAGTSPSAATVRAALSVFDAYYSNHYFARSRVYPGVIATLERLRAAGLLCACITNKRIAFATPLLADAGLAELLDYVYGADSAPRKKPFPDLLIAAAGAAGVEARDAVMVGDSPNDMDAASSAGWEFVYARYGYTAAMQARGVAPRAAIERFEDLVPLLLGKPAR